MLKNIDIKSILLNGRNYLLCGLTFIGTGLSVSKPLMSLGLIFLLAAWVVDGKIIQKFKSFLSNKTAIVLSSVYLITLLGLIHTSNYSYGFDDARKKLALLVVPLILSGFSPLTKKEFRFLLKVFVFWVAFSCVWSFCVYFGATGELIVDKREYSRFTSHIRFGLEIALAFFISLYLLKTTRFIKLKVLWLTFLFIELFTLYFFSFITGSIALAIGISTTSLFYGFTSKHFLIKLGLFSILLGVILFFSWFLYSSISDFYRSEKIKPLKEISQTIHGEKYQKDGYTDNSSLKENGYYIEKNIAWSELSKAWNERSKIDFEGKDLKGNWIKNTLIRFITSKGQRKDRQAVENLSTDELKAIEGGVANVKYLTMNGFRVRLHKILWEYNAYKNGRDINGHSVLMRWEYLKVTLHLIKNNFWFGIGTGDIQDAYKEYYKNNDSLLTEHYRRRGHNQYLTYFVTLGVFGGVWFLIVLFYPFFKLNLHSNFLYLAFFSILCFSMFSEDTLENQVGIYFFVFFNSIFTLQNKNLTSNNYD